MSQVLTTYMDKFNLTGVPVDFALRQFFLECYLPKEAQLIDRIINAFATKYHNDNPNLFPSADCAYLISFALVLLQTDLHNPNNRRKMTRDQFVWSARQTEGGHEIPPELLEILYDNTATEKFAWPSNDDEIDVDGERMFTRSKNQAVAIAGKLVPKSSHAVLPGWLPRWVFARKLIGHLPQPSSMMRRSFSDTQSCMTAEREEVPAKDMHSASLSTSFDLQSKCHLYPFSLIDHQAHAQLLIRLDSCRPDPEQYTHLGPSHNVDYETITKKFLSWRADDDDTASLAETRRMNAATEIAASSPVAIPTPRPPSLAKFFTQNLSDKSTSQPSENRSSPTSVQTDRRTPNSIKTSHSILRLTKEGMLRRKTDRGESGRRTSLRSWRDFWVILSGSQLLFFTEVDWFLEQKRKEATFGSGKPRPATPKPFSVLSTGESICVIDKELNRTKRHYENVFRLATPGGRQYLLQAESSVEMTEWMALVNYAAAYKSVGLRVRGVGETNIAIDPPHQPSNSARNGFYLGGDGNQDTGSNSATLYEANAGRNGSISRTVGGMRADVLRSKIDNITRHLDVAQGQISSNLRLVRHLHVAIPLTKSTREKVIDWAYSAQTRVRTAALEAERLRCYRDILTADLRAEEKAGDGVAKGESKEIQRHSFAPTPVDRGNRPPSDINKADRTFSADRAMIVGESSDATIDQFRNRTTSEPGKEKYEVRALSEEVHTGNHGESTSPSRARRPISPGTGPLESDRWESQVDPSSSSSLSSSTKNEVKRAATISSENSSVSFSISTAEPAECSSYESVAPSETRGDSFVGSAVQEPERRATRGNARLESDIQRMLFLGSFPSDLTREVQIQSSVRSVGMTSTDSFASISIVRDMKENTEAGEDE